MNVHRKMKGQSTVHPPTTTQVPASLTGPEPMPSIAKCRTQSIWAFACWNRCWNCAWQVLEWPPEELAHAHQCALQTRFPKPLRTARAFFPKKYLGLSLRHRHGRVVTAAPLVKVPMACIAFNRKRARSSASRIL